MQHGGYVLIDGCQVVAAVANEHDEVCCVEGYIRFSRYLGGKTVIQRGADAAGIHQQGFVIRDAAGRAESVAGDAGLVMHDGDAPPDHAVEDG